MKFPSPSNRSKAFTLLELIVVIVILGILAALAVPTFASVINRSKDQTTLAQLQSVGRNVMALKAFNNGDDIGELVETAAHETRAPKAAADALLAAAPEGMFDAAEDAKAPAKGDLDIINYDVVESGKFDGSLVLSMRSSTGNVAAVLIEEDSTNQLSKVGSLGDSEAVVTLFDSEATTPDPEETEDPETPVIPVLATPAGLTSSYANNNVTLSWGAVDGAENYRVGAYVDGVRVGEVQTTTSTSWTQPAAAEMFGKTVEFRVTAEAEGKTTSNAATSSVTVPFAVLGAPSNFTATLSGPPISPIAMLAWTPMPGAVSYHVSYTVNGVESTTTSNSQYKTVFLDPGTVSVYKVAAVNADGVMGAYTAEQTVTAPFYAAPTFALAPTPTTSSSYRVAPLETDGTLRIASINRMSGATSYVVSVDGQPVQTIEQFSTSKLENITITGLTGFTAGSTHTISVVAKSPAGDSPVASTEGTVRPGLFTSTSENRLRFATVSGSPLVVQVYIPPVPGATSYIVHATQFTEGGTYKDQLQTYNLDPNGNLQFTLPEKGSYSIKMWSVNAGGTGTNLVNGTTTYTINSSGVGTVAGWSFNFALDK